MNMSHHTLGHDAPPHSKPGQISDLVIDAEEAVRAGNKGIHTGLQFHYCSEKLHLDSFFHIFSLIAQQQTADR